jgi:hypothetical protein
MTCVRCKQSEARGFGFYVTVDWGPACCAPTETYPRIWTMMPAPSRDFVLRHVYLT